MLINIVVSGKRQQSWSLDIPVDLGIEGLKAIIDEELGTQNYTLFYCGKMLDSLDSLTALDGSVQTITVRLEPTSEAMSKKFDWKSHVDSALKQVNINANMAAALEHHPEAFVQVCMLYVRMTVNGHALFGFVDTGAQATIISEECARKCGIKHLIDERFQGIAKGVGTGRIVGRVHSVVISVGQQHLSCALTVMEGTIGPDVIFGLDMLKRHQVLVVFFKTYFR